MSDIHTFHHHAMATYYEVRIADEERTYAAQAAQAAIDLLDKLEMHLSRFRPDSDVARIGAMAHRGDDATERAGLCLSENRQGDGVGHSWSIFRHGGRTADTE